MSELILPKSWEAPPIEECCDLNPKIDKSSFLDEQEVHFVPMPSVEALVNKVDVSRMRLFGEVKKGYTPFAGGDVIFAKITPCMENGKIAVVPELPNKLALGSTEFHVIRPLSELPALWFFFYLSARSYRSDAEHNMTGAVGQRRVPIGFIAQTLIPLPPLNEQKRIVAKIEELFSELEAGEESFRQARRQLGVYRQSLLKQAFEGKLTATWRKQNPHLLESPDKLLERIKSERKERYEKQLKVWKTAVEKSVSNGDKKPPKPSLLKAVGGSNDIFESSFPKEWHLMNLSQIALELGQGWSPKCENHAASSEEWGVMKTTAIQPGRFQPEASKVLPSKLSPRPWLGLRNNDILITRAGPRSRCGVVCRVVGDHPKLLLCDKAYRLAFSEEATFAEFIELLLCSPVASDAIENLKTGINDSGVNITQTSFLQLAVPIPTLPEQQEIVRLLDEQFTVIEQNEREIDAALKRSEALRQSILKKAFSGQLVPQDPTDEPATTLLARIRKERENQKQAAALPMKKAASRKKAKRAP